MGALFGLTVLLMSANRWAYAQLVDVGARHVCATVGSTAKCWGDNKWGQLGREDNTTQIGDDPDELGDNLVGVPVAGVVADMALGKDHTCMLLDASSEVVCFGRNVAGQLGLGDTVDRGQTAGSVGEAVDFGASVAAVAITAGCEHTCALLDDGAVKCFGQNNFGQLGQDTTDNAGGVEGQAVADLPAVPLDGTVTAIAGGCDSTCALMDDGSVICWGRNTFGQLGTGDSPDRLDGNDIPLVAVDLDGSVATAIAAGEAHVCALLDDDSVKCWGRNDHGQLGQGDELDRGDSPEDLGVNLTAVSLGAEDVPTAIDCGSDYTCILLADATVKCFGENRDGQLGTGTTVDVGLLPTDMGDNLVAAETTGVQDFAAGGSTTCAVLAGDSVICWGLGSDGQTGQGSDEAVIDIGETAPVDAGNDTFALTPAPTTTLPSASPSSAAAVTATAAPSAVPRQIGSTDMPVTLAPLGPGETFAPTPVSSSGLDAGTEGGNSAPAHFKGGLLATIVLGAVGFLGNLFL